MTRTSLFVAFLMSCSVTTALDRVSTVFNNSVNPCTDLYGHVCVDDPEIVDLRERSTRGLVNDIAAILKKRGGDPVLKRILEAVYKEDGKTESQKRKCRLEGYGVTEANMESQSEYKLGTVYAEMFVHGRFEEFTAPLYVSCQKDQRNRKKCTVTQRGGYSIKEDKFGKLPNEFVKGVVDRFAKLMNFDLGANDSVKYPYVNSNYVLSEMMAKSKWETDSDLFHTLTSYKDDDSEEMYAFVIRNIFVSSLSFSAYGNVLLTHTLYTNKDKLNPDVGEEFDRLAAKIKEEVSLNIKDSDWLGNVEKHSLLHYMYSLQIHIGVPKKYRNVTLLEEMLQRYRTAFANTPLDGECDLEMLSRTHGVVRHQMITEGIGTVDTQSIAMDTMPVPTDSSLFVYNAMHFDNQI
uniref:Peptidase_M13_N domain-containing protein n=1 Tax=Steinernema glaseri TaxID=37863 RepID=A0A1I7Y1P8_9BILA